MNTFRSSSCAEGAQRLESQDPGTSPTDPPVDSATSRGMTIEVHAPEQKNLNDIKFQTTSNTTLDIESLHIAYNLPILRPWLVVTGAKYGVGYSHECWASLCSAQPTVLGRRRSGQHGAGMKLWILRGIADPVNGKGDIQGIIADGAGNPNYTGYLGTPNGTFWKFQPSSGKGSEVFK